MKVTYRIPTKDQYAFVEIEDDGFQTDNQLREKYDALTALFKDGPGLEHLRWNALLDGYLTTGTVPDGGNVWEELCEWQRIVINEIKKSRKRTG